MLTLPQWWAVPLVSLIWSILINCPVFIITDVTLKEHQSKARIAHYRYSRTLLTTEPSIEHAQCMPVHTLRFSGPRHPT